MSIFRIANGFQRTVLARNSLLGYARNEFSSLRDLQNKAKRQIGGQWKALTSKEQQLFKDMERMEFDEKAKKKALPPVKPRKMLAQSSLSM